MYDVTLAGRYGASTRRASAQRAKRTEATGIAAEIERSEIAAKSPAAQRVAQMHRSGIHARDERQIYRGRCHGVRLERLGPPWVREFTRNYSNVWGFGRTGGSFRIDMAEREGLFAAGADSPLAGPLGGQNVCTNHDAMHYRMTAYVLSPRPAIPMGLAADPQLRAPMASGGVRLVYTLMIGQTQAPYASVSEPRTTSPASSTKGVEMNNKTFPKIVVRHSAFLILPSSKRLWTV